MHKGNSVDVSWRHAVNQRVRIKDWTLALSQGLFRDQEHTSERRWHLSDPPSQCGDSRENKKLFTLSSLTAGNLPAVAWEPWAELQAAAVTVNLEKQQHNWSLLLLSFGSGQGRSRMLTGRKGAASRGQRAGLTGNSYAPLACSAPIFDPLTTLLPGLPSWVTQTLTDEMCQRHCVQHSSTCGLWY